MARWWLAPMIALALAAPAAGQITVLDQAQDAAGGARQTAAEPSAPSEAGVPDANAPLPPACGRQPFAVARMSWPSAAILAEIHARLLAEHFGCEVRVTPGDLAATASSMGSTGQPAVAPEMWVTRIADVWNGAVESQMVRSAAPTFDATAMEGWYMPASMAGLFAAPPSGPELASSLPGIVAEGETIRFISCPADWACSVINRNLLEAYGLAGMVEVVEPANRFEMDTLIAEAFSRREPVLFYYWQPNAVLAQLDVVAIDLGAFDEAAAKCLAARACAAPTPSGFPNELVVMAVSDWVFTDIPEIAGYFQRSTMAIDEMDQLLAQLNDPGATVETVAERFVAERADIWRTWIGQAP